MKKVLSVILAMLMVVAMIPTVFAASTPVITTKANKTSIKAGDVVTITVSVSKNSKLCALTYELSYNTSEFSLVSGSTTTKGVFGAEMTNDSVAGKIKYVGAATTYIADAAQTLFTVQLKAKKSTGKVTVSISEAYVSSGSASETNVTSAVASASTKSISFKAAADYIAIRTPSRTSIRYKDGIVLHADVKSTLPSGSKLKWTSNNSNFNTEVSSDGKSYTIISNSNGATVFTVTLYSSSGAVLETETIEMTSKAGFFDKIGGFFRGLFGATKIYSE